MQQDPRFIEAEQFKQRVINQAILLGFTAEEYTSVRHSSSVWRFTYDNHSYGSYASVYTAAVEYLRLSKVPSHLWGKVNHGP